MITRLTFSDAEVRQIIRDHVGRTHITEGHTVLVSFGVEAGRLVDAEVTMTPINKTQDPK